MVQNRKNRKIAIQSFTVPQAREWAKWANEWRRERSGASMWSEQGGASERVSGASETANGRVSGSVLLSGFLDILDHCVTELVCPSIRLSIGPSIRPFVSLVRLSRTSLITHGFWPKTHRLIEEFAVEHRYEEHLFQEVLILPSSTAQFLRNKPLMVVDSLDEWCFVPIFLLVYNLKAKRKLILNPVDPIAPSFGVRSNWQNCLGFSIRISKGELKAFDGFVNIRFPDHRWICYRCFFVLSGCCSDSRNDVLVVTANRFTEIKVTSTCR